MSFRIPGRPSRRWWRLLPNGAKTRDDGYLAHGLNAKQWEHCWRDLQGKVASQRECDAIELAKLDRRAVAKAKQVEKTEKALVKCMISLASSFTGEVRLVPAAYTSTTCSSCGHWDASSRKSQAVFECTGYGLSANADTNAARNILKAGTRPCDGRRGAPAERRGSRQGATGLAA